MRQSLALLAMLSLVTVPAYAQVSDINVTRGAKDIFAGCTDEARAPLSTSNPRDRVENRNRPTVDKATQRQFASFSIDEIEAGAAANMDASCWAKLDGVWQDETIIALDRRLDDPDTWGSDSIEALALTNGNYTTPKYLVVIESRDPEKMLFVATGLEGDRFAKFVSRDGIPFEDVMKRGGKRKVYEADGRFRYGDKLFVDVTASGRLRMGMRRDRFYRPSIGKTSAQLQAQLKKDDVFLVGLQMENLAATRTGYDVVTQDPFLLNSNDKAEIFARSGDKQYTIDERRIVPVGYNLRLQDALQGMVYRKSMMANSSDIQSTVSSTLGGHLGGKLNVVAGSEHSIAADYTKTMVDTLSTRNAVARAIGYSRSKKYTLIVDHAYVGLSNDFIDAVEEARRYGNYADLIRKFGTHYPYAVTYGAAARMAQSYTEEEFVNKMATDWDVKGSYEGNANVANKIIAEVDWSANFRYMQGESIGNGAEYSRDDMEFFGVGGNGSWNENGWMAGETPYPVLLDLRPISELLNPMNFPGEPEVYDIVRLNLRKSISAYLNANKLVVDNELPGLPDKATFDRLRPRKKVEPTETYFVYIRHAWCTGSTSGRAKSVQGTMLKISQIGALGEPNETIKTSGLKAECKMIKPKVTSIGYAQGDPGLLVISGTREEMRNATVRLDLEWDYNPGKKVRTDYKILAGEFDALKDEQRRDLVWTVKGVALPDYKLRIRIKRKR